MKFRGQFVDPVSDDESSAHMEVACLQMAIHQVLLSLHLPLPSIW